MGVNRQKSGVTGYIQSCKGNSTKNFEFVLSYRSKSVSNHCVVSKYGKTENVRKSSNCN